MMLETTFSIEHAELATPTTVDRAAALKRWRVDHPLPEADEATLAEACRVARVFQSEDSPIFDPVSFADLVEFIEELPF